MPQKTSRSESRIVGFQCADQQYQLIVKAAEDDQRTISEWIRKTLMDAVRRAG